MSDNHRSRVFDPILDYPEFAATLGMVMSQAAYLEAQLAEVFSHVSGAPPTRGSLIYWSFPTFNQRQRVMDTLLAEGYQPYKSEIEGILRRAKKFLKFRNSCAHDLWERRDSNSSPVHRITANLVRDSGEGEVKVMLKEMREKVKSAVKLNADIAELIDRL